MPVEWSRVNLHARRIKRLGFTKVEDSYVPCEQPMEAETYQILALHRPTISILPHLQYIGLADTEIQAYITMFLSRSIIEVSVKWSPLMGQGEEISSLIDSVKAYSPNIWKLEMDLEDMAEVLLEKPDITDSAFQLPHLRVFGCKLLNLTDTSLVQLAGLASLTDLCARICFDPTTGLSEYSDSPFPTLSLLDVYVENIEHFTSLTKVISSRHLEVLQLRLDGPPRAIPLQKMFQALSTHSSRMRLHTISVEIFPKLETTPSTPVYSIHPTILQPLLSMKNIQDITIKLPCLYDLTDSILNDMALAWPYLIHLDIAPEIWCTDQHPETTLGGLVPFADHCPLLTTLRILVDGGRIPKLDFKPRRSRRSKLSSLNVEFSPTKILRTTLIAAYLTAYFPSLQAIEAIGEDSVRWAEISRRLRIFNFVRGCEREAAIDAIREGQQNPAAIIDYANCE